MLRSSSIVVLVGFVSGSDPVRVWVRGSCLGTRFVSGFVSGSYPVRVWFVSGLVSGFASGLGPGWCPVCISFVSGWCLG